MSDTRRVVVVANSRTIIKKVKIGTPVRSVSIGGITSGGISDIDTNNPSAGDILVYQPSSQTYYTAQLVGGTNIDVSYDSNVSNSLTINTTLGALSGSIIPDSNEVYDLGSSDKKFRDLYLSGNTINLGGLKLQDEDGTFVVKDSNDNIIFTEVSLSTTNENILSFDSSSGMLTFRDSDVARTDIDETFHKNLTVVSGLTADSATLGGINLSGNDLTTTGKLYYANVFSNEVDLPSASTYHGMFAHVHATGRAYFAHNGAWHKLIDSDTTDTQQVYSLTSNDADISTLNFTSLGSDAVTAIRNEFAGGTGLTYTSGTGTFDITNTGVIAGTYGSSTQVPQLTINAQGQVDSAGLITISGVTGVDFDSATGTITIQTTGGDFSDVITLDPYTTSNLVEGSNLYYTDDRFDIRLATKTTDDVSEGSNLYYTTARADSDAKNAISVTDAGGDGSLTYTPSTGVITYTGPNAAEVRAHLVAGTGVTYDSASGVISIGQPVGLTDNVTFNDVVVSGNLTVSGSTTTINTETINLADNQIVLNSNFDSGAPTENGGISVRRGDELSKELIWNETLDKWTVGSETFVAATFEGNLTGQVSDISNHSTTDLSEGDNLYYTTARADSAFDVRLATKTTNNLTEGDNLYYTTARADSAFDIRLTTKTTTNLAEGDNLYYTTARADSAFDVRLATKTTDDVTEGNNLYYTTARADSDAKNSISVTDAGGDGSLTYSAATGIITYTGPSATEVRAHFARGAGLSYDSPSGTFSITETGAIAGTYGSNTAIPVVTVNALGQIDSIGTVGVSGITGVDFDSATGTLTINTSTGNFTDVITLDPYTTTGLVEGSNLYYTTARADSDAKNAVSVTDAGGDGSLTYSSATGVFTYTGPSASETRAHLVAGTGITYDSSTGVIASAYQAVDTTDSVTFSGLYVSGNTVLGGNLTVTGTTTTVNTETINLADNTILLNSNHTGAATQSAGIEIERGTDSNASLLWDEAANRWSVQGDGFVAGTFYGNLIGNVTGTVSDISNHSTSDLSEGTNLYYTTARADSDAKNSVSVTDAGGDGSLTYNNGTGVFTYTGPSASEVRSHINVSGDLSYDSATGQLSFTERTEQGVRDIFSVSGDLAYDSNTGQFAFTERTDQEVRNLFSVSGDLNYDSSTGQFSIDVEQVYTKANFDSDFDVRIGEKSTTDLSEGNNLYYTTARADSDAKNAISVTDAGGDGSLSYNAGTGVITYTGPSATEVRSHLSVSGDLAYDSSTGQFSFTERTDQEVRNLLSVSGDLAYDSSTGQFSFTERTEQQVRNLFSSGGDLSYDSNTGQFSINVDAVSIADSAVRHKLSAGGDLSYDSSTGQFSFTQRTDAQVRGLVSGDKGLTYNSSTGEFNVDSSNLVTLSRNALQSGTGVTYDSASGQISIGQAVGTTDDVTFAGMTISGNLTVTGTETIVNTTNLSVNDSLIKLADSNETSDVLDIGFIGHYYRNGQSRHTGVFRDASNEEYYIFNNLVDSSFDSAPAPNVVNRSGTGFTLSTLNVGALNSTAVTSGTILVDSASIKSLAQEVSINNLSEDTTPQLGGNLDLNSSNITGTGNIDVTGNFTLTSTDDGSSAAPEIDLVRNSSSPADADYLGQIKFTGENDADQSVLYAKITGKISDASDTTEDGLIEYAVKKAGSNTIVQRLTGTALKLINGTGLEVAGNITVDGTVDGRDVATDGSKLDGIEASAKDDQTITAGNGLSGGGTGDVTLNIDSANVRGMFSGGTGITYNSGSGAISTTDGDIVHDNLSGFVANEHIDHSSVSITAGTGLSGGGDITSTRTLNVGAGAGITVNADNLQIDSSYTRGLFSASGDLSYNSGTGAFSFTERTNQEVRNLFSTSGDLAYDSSTGQFSFSETYSTANELLTAIKTVDGSGSGLDADTLDGQEGTHYRINVYNASGTLLN